MMDFSKESFAFLRGLEQRNDREWFNENKPRFQTHLEEPFINLLETLSERLSDTPLPLSGGKSTVFRMNRDVRFSKDKSPYKTSMSGMLTPSGNKSESQGVLYLQLQKGGGFVAAGFYNLSPTQLIPIRDAMVEREKQFDAVLTSLSKAGRSLDDMHVLSSMPRGYSQYDEHRHASHLKRKSLLVTEELSEEDWVSGDAIGRAEKLARDTMPLLRFQNPGREA